MKEFNVAYIEVY